MTRVISALVAAVALAQPDPLVSGIEAYSRGDYLAAERSLREATRTAGGEPRARAFLALTLAATSRCDEAEGGLRTAAESGTGDLRRLAGLALAQCHLARQRLDDAAAVLRSLRTAWPADADVLYLSARLYGRAWNATIHQLYQHNPASFRVNQLSGEILEMQGQFGEAAAEYRKAIAKNPRAVNLHFRLGRALLMSSQEPQMLETARQAFEAELALNPLDSVAEYQVGQVLLVQQKTAPAALRFERALVLNPGFVEALVALGKLRSVEKRDGDAIALLERAVKLAPRSESARYSLMMAYRNAGRVEDAKREKAELDKLQKTPEGEFTEFLKKLGQKPPPK